jgi:hypothetical protein
MFAKMITDKIIKNKIYMYAGKLHKVKRIHKTKNKALIQNMMTSEEVYVPIEQSEIILQRIYTIGEVSKIVERRPDTIRKYEKKGLIPKPLKIEDDYPSYRNWRFYTSADVYEMVEFFSDRSPGRPVKEKKINVQNKIKNLDQRVRLSTLNIGIQEKIK